MNERTLGYNFNYACPFSPTCAARTRELINRSSSGTRVPCCVNCDLGRLISGRDGNLGTVIRYLSGN
jgi:Zn-finger protein